MTFLLTKPIVENHKYSRKINFNQNEGTTSQNNNSKILPTSKCTESNVTKQLEIDMMSEVNRTISERATHSFQKWKKHDSNLDFCDIENEEDENLIFVDLLKVIIKISH